MPGNVAPVANEREGLLAFLAQQRAVLKIAAYGLTEEQIRTAPSASALTVGGLVKHCTAMERGWMDTVLERPGEADASRYGEDFRVGPDETLAGLLADFDLAGRETEAVVAGIAHPRRPGPGPHPPPVPPGGRVWA